MKPPSGVPGVTSEPVPRAPLPSTMSGASRVTDRRGETIAPERSLARTGRARRGRRLAHPVRSADAAPAPCSPRHPRDQPATRRGVRNLPRWQTFGVSTLHTRLVRFWASLRQDEDPPLPAPVAIPPHRPKENLMSTRTEYRYNRLIWPEMNDSIEIQKLVILPTGSTASKRSSSSTATAPTVPSST